MNNFIDEVIMALFEKFGYDCVIARDEDDIVVKIADQKFEISNSGVSYFDPVEGKISWGKSKAGNFYDWLEKTIF